MGLSMEIKHQSPPPPQKKKKKIKLQFCFYQSCTYNKTFPKSSHWALEG